MADELVETRAETQADYDRAAIDYIARMSEMSAEQAAAHFKRVEWIKNYQPEASTHCPMCGETVMELKWANGHTEWQCLEPTCRNQWEWRHK